MHVEFPYQQNLNTKQGVFHARITRHTPRMQNEANIGTESEEGAAHRKGVVVLACKTRWVLSCKLRLA